MAAHRCLPVVAAGNVDQELGWTREVQEDRRDLKAMCLDYPGMPTSMSAVVAVLMGSLGSLALLAVIFRA